MGEAVVEDPLLSFKFFTLGVGAEEVPLQGECLEREGEIDIDREHYYLRGIDIYITVEY